MQDILQTRDSSLQRSKSLAQGHTTGVGAGWNTCVIASLGPERPIRADVKNLSALAPQAD